MMLVNLLQGRKPDRNKSTLNGSTFRGIVDSYGLGELRTFKKLGGRANDDFYLRTTKGEYVVKFLRQYPEFSVAQEMLILDRLLKHGCKGVNYLKDLDGNFIHHIGDKIISLQPFILNSKTADKNIMVQEVASGLAQLHQVPFSDLPNRLSWFDPGVVKLSLEGVKTHKPDLHAKYIVAYDLVNVEKLEALPRSIIHGDISVANCLFDSDGNLLDFIDWEETMIAPAVFDLAMTIAAFCMEGNKFEPHLVTTALTSYQKERELSKNELQELSHAVYYVRLVLSLWFYNQFNIRTKSKEFSSLYKFFWEEEATLNEKVIDEVVEQVAKSLATA